MPKERIWVKINQNLCEVADLEEGIIYHDLHRSKAAAQKKELKTTKLRADNLHVAVANESLNIRKHTLNVRTHNLNIRKTYCRHS